MNQVRALLPLGNISLLAVVLTLAGCASAEKRSLGKSAPKIAAPPSSGATLSDRTSEQAYAESPSRALTRTAYNTAEQSAAADSGLTVEVRDLLVGPGIRTDPFSLPGGVLLETRSGGGTARVDGEPYELGTGTTLAVAEGSTIALEADQGVSLTVRAFIISLR